MVLVETPPFSLDEKPEPYVIADYYCMERVRELNRAVLTRKTPVLMRKGEGWFTHSPIPWWGRIELDTGNFVGRRGRDR